MDEEQQIFNRCSSRQIYMSLCVNAIKRIRELPNAVKDSISKSNETKKHLVKPMMDSYADVAAQLVSSITPSKTVIRPSTIPLAKTEKKHSSLLSCTQEVNRRRSSSYDISDLTGWFSFLICVLLPKIFTGYFIVKQSSLKVNSTFFLAPFGLKAGHVEKAWRKLYLIKTV